MKKPKKFKRFSEGGLGSSEGEGDPFAKKTEFDPERVAKARKNFANFFMGRRSEDEASAPIDDSRERYASTSASGMMNPSLRPGQGRRRDDGDGEPAKAPPPSGRREIPPTPLTKEEKRADYEGGEDATSGGQTFTASRPPKPAAGSSASGPKPAAKPPKEDTSYRDIENARGARTKPSAPAAEKTPAAPAKSKVPAKIDSEKLPRDTEEEVLRKKPTAMTEQMRKAPTINDLYRGQKSMGDEIGDALKSFRASIRQGNRQGKADALNEQSNPPPFDWRERKKNKGKFVIEHEYAKGGKVKAYAQGGFVSRGDGCAQRGKTKGRMV